MKNQLHSACHVANTANCAFGKDGAPNAAAYCSYERSF